MENKEIELLPCPFCGGAVSFGTYCSGQDGYLPRISCHCGVKYEGLCSEESLSRCWNKRTPSITTVDLANADADGFRNGRASVVVELPKIMEDPGPVAGMSRKWSEGWNESREASKLAIIAAGGSVKE